MTAASDRLLLLNIGSPSRLLSIPPDGGQMEVLIADLGVAPDGLAVDGIRHRIYWTYMGTSHDGEVFLVNDGSIHRVDYDGTNRTVVIPEGGTFTPKQMKCDAANGFIYWCDREGMRVMGAQLDGSAPTVLVQTGATDEDRTDPRRHCVGVAVDPTGGFIYWTQKGKPNGGEGRIFRAPLNSPVLDDPAARSDIELVFDKLPEPIDLEWEPDTGFLYWTDRGDPPTGNTLNRALIQPGLPPTREVLLSGIHEAIGLAVDQAGGRVFVSDLGGFVRVVDLRRPGDETIVFSGHGPLTGIAYQRA